MPARVAQLYVVIAHRLSPAQNTDTIAVVGNDRVVEQGSHHELMARGKAYATLVESKTAECCLSNE